jgi:hypothetical protein
MTDDASIRSLLTLLVPGDGGNWPAAGDVVTPAQIETDDGAAAALVASLAAAMRDAGPEAAAQAVADAESLAPAAFEAMLRAIYAAYYTSGPVQAAVIRLAESGPREISPHFDADLLARTTAARRQPGGD